MCQKREQKLNEMGDKTGKHNKQNRTEENRTGLISKRFTSTQKGFKHIFMWNCQVY